MYGFAIPDERRRTGLQRWRIRMINQSAQRWNRRRGFFSRGIDAANVMPFVRNRIGLFGQFLARTQAGTARGIVGKARQPQLDPATPPARSRCTPVHRQLAETLEFGQKLLKRSKNRRRARPPLNQPGAASGRGDCYLWCTLDSGLPLRRRQRTEHAMMAWEANTRTMLGPRLKL